jgi:ferredoxin
VWPNITEMKAPAADSEDWAGKPDKLQYLER